MRHFVQYYNPDKIGRPFSHDHDGDLSVYTNKPYPLLLSVLGNAIWLIAGEGQPRAYSLCYAFVADEVGACEHPSFRWYARGAVGERCVPPVRVDHELWFGAFLHRMANFSLGLRELRPDDVGHLRRLSGLMAD